MTATHEPEPDGWTRAQPIGPPASRTPMPYYPPPHPHYPPPYRPAVPPKKGLGAGAIVAIVLGSIAAVSVLGCLGLVVLGAADIASTPKPTVTVESCTWDGYFGHLKYVLRNQDKRPHNYWIEATMGHTSMIPDSRKGVAPGEQISGELVGGSQGDCRITSVDQT